MFGLRLLWRDWRGGELGILFSALVIAVAIVTGIALFADRIQQGLVDQSSDFLAADRVLQSSKPINDEWLERARSQGLNDAQILSFPSMVFIGDKMQRASVKAVSNRYPLRGELEVSDKPFATSYKVTAGPQAGEVWVDNRLLPLLGASIGDQLTVGETELTISRIVIREPDSGGNPMGFGARVLMNTEDIVATQVVRPGSRVAYRYLFTGDKKQLAVFGAWIQANKNSDQRWLALEDSQPAIAQALDRAKGFLLMAGSLGVGLAGVAIALAARRYSERHYDYVAMMKSLGASSTRIMSIYTLNLIVLSIIAIIVGCFAGWLIQAVFINMLSEYITLSNIPAITIKPFITGAITALVCLLAFALPPLINLQGVSPLRVIRRDIEQKSISSLVTYAVGVAGMIGLMTWYSGDVKLTIAVMAGVALTLTLGAGLAWFMLRGSKVVGMQAGSAMSLAMAAMRRRGLQNSIQVVIFSLAIMLLLILTLVRSSLIEEWQVQLPDKTPNHFLMNVATEEVDEITQLLKTNGLDTEHLYPMVRGRLMVINREAITINVSKEERRGADLERPLNLSWAQDLPFENEVIAGQWWSSDSSKTEVSVESRLASRLNIKVGDTLGFSLDGTLLEVTVSNIRSLNWDSMRPNFYMIFPPDLLKDYPVTFISSFYLPPEKKIFLNTFVTEFPTVVVIEMDAIINQIRDIITQVSSAIELVLGLIIISGLLVLIASVQASLDSRYQESAILRTLGAKRSIVLGSLIIEFCGLGFLAGLLAALTAEVSVYAMQDVIVNMEYKPHLWVWIAGPLLGASLIGLAGYITCRKVVNTPPVEVLREI